MILLLLLFPSYRYIIDADAIGYIGIAERYAKADYHNAINGLWSPLNCWLLVPFLKAGFDPVLAAKYLNCIYGFIALTAFFFLIRKLKIQSFAAVGILIAALLLMLHFVFYKLFGDLLQLTFLLIYMNIICTNNFIDSYKKIAIAAIIGGIGFYSKAYTFYFVAVHLSVLFFLSERKKNGRWFSRELFKKISFTLIILVLIVMPWAFAMKSKYGQFTLSTVGQYNITWSLSQAYEQKRILIEPPPYADSYSIWEDPTFRRVTNITPFTSPKLFLFQVKLIFSNAIDFLKELNNFSFLTIAAMLFSCFLAVAKKRYFVSENKDLAILSFVAIWPLGLLLLHIEARFLWIMLLLILLLTGKLLTYFSDSISRKIWIAVVLVTTASFCLYPVYNLKDSVGSGKTAFQMADAFAKNNIRGNTISNQQNYDELQQSLAVCYLLKNKFYGPMVSDYSSAEILNAIKEYHIEQYIVFYHTSYEKEEILSGLVAKNATTVSPDIFPGLIVLSFKD